MKKMIRSLGFLALAFFFTLGMAQADSGELDMGATVKSGAVDEAEYHIATHTQKGNLSAFAKVYYSEQEGERKEAKTSAGTEYNRPIADSNVSGWIVENLGTNFAQKIRCENFAGTGLKYTFSDTDKLHLSLSVGYLHHLVDYYDVDRAETHRGSIRPKARYKTGPWDLRFVGYWQPSAEDWQDDYILKGTGSVGYWFDKTWGAKLMREDEYRSESLVDENYTVRMSVGVTRKW